MQKEFKQLLGAIDKWVKVNNGQVLFIGSFVSFDQKKIKENTKDCIKDNMVLAYGDSDSVKLTVSELKKMVDKDKIKFINW